MVLNEKWLAIGAGLLWPFKDLQAAVCTDQAPRHKMRTESNFDLCNNANRGIRWKVKPPCRDSSFITRLRLFFPNKKWKICNNSFLANWKQQKRTNTVLMNSHFSGGFHKLAASCCLIAHSADKEPRCIHLDSCLLQFVQLFHSKFELFSVPSNFWGQ